MENKFKLESLGDIFTPIQLIKANYPGGKASVYSLFNRKDFPAIRHGKKFLVSKRAFIEWFEKQAQQGENKKPQAADPELKRNMKEW